MSYLHDAQRIPDVEKFIAVNPELEPAVSVDYFLSVVRKGSRVDVAIDPGLTDEKTYTVEFVKVESAVHGAVVFLALRAEDGSHIVISFPDVVLITESPLPQKGHKFYFYCLNREDFFAALEESRLPEHARSEQPHKCSTVYRLYVRD
ncbi:hypothetical protein [Alicyclobacillus macrosporangiidus]|uniref:Uncharacterized protein n=1 Tax=Alicyclobacillus macrosporangiidus TaxID=392015 RepID=A0A1I7KD93_9BACL|nr:hypothetical protein [Alicyclobacillus macrosporangiidus]SFU95404.1 hypothetical protein SAMN05421543_11548 [Alicyclobacillus macrosporangiidus]